MIDASRWTKTERELVDNALAAYAFKLERVSISHENHARRSDAQWRLYEIERIRGEIDGR